MPIERVEIHRCTRAVSPNENSDKFQMVLFLRGNYMSRDHKYTSLEDAFASLILKHCEHDAVLQLIRDNLRIKCGDMSDEYIYGLLLQIKPDVLFDFLSNHIWIKWVYGYSHGGLALSLTPFSCRWDSGLAGFIYSKFPAEECDADSCSEFISQYEAYLNGSVYSVTAYDGDEAVVNDTFYGEPFYLYDKYKDMPLIQQKVAAYLAEHNDL